jgi:hypothetical protein
VSRRAESILIALTILALAGLVFLAKHRWHLI